jgi:drug/metabolite transporter (DMT)-like permease
VISYLFAILAAVTNATSNVLNRRATREEPIEVHFRLRLFLDLVRRRAWLTAVGMMAFSFLFSAIALGTGQLATVQIIVTMELPLTLIGAAMFLTSGLGRREVLAIVAMAAGVVGVLTILDPRTGGAPTSKPAIVWILGSAINASAVVILFLTAKATKNMRRQAGLLGAACGLSYGLASAFTKGMTEQFGTHGFVGVLASWQLWAAAAAGITATWLLENAYQAGSLAAAQPGITLLDPTAATIWGVFVFGEHVRSGIYAAIAIVPLAVLITGVVNLSSSSCLRTAAGTDEARARARQPRGMEAAAERGPGR